MFDLIDDMYLMDGWEEVKFRYMRGDLVLISGLFEERMYELCAQERDNCQSIFKSIQKLYDNIVSTNKLVWIVCVGVPISAWGRNVFLSWF